MGEGAFRPVVGAEVRDARNGDLSQPQRGCAALARRLRLGLLPGPLPGLLQLDIEHHEFNQLRAVQSALRGASAGPGTGWWVGGAPGSARGLT